MMMRYLAFLFVFALLFSLAGLSQDDESLFRVKTGHGIWESSHFGANIKTSPMTSVGAGYGKSPGIIPFSTSYYSFFLEFNRYFGRPNIYSESPWFSNTRVIFWKNEDEKSITRALAFCSTIGRDFYIRRNLGVSFDTGLIFSRLFIEEWKTQDHDRLVSPVSIEVRLHLFYKF